MDVLVERCAGLDVHRDSVMATVRLPGKRSRQREQHSRGFGSTIAELHALGDWLQGFGVTLVGMERPGSTGARSSTRSSRVFSAGF
jgi:hypothetical protein